MTAVTHPAQPPRRGGVRLGSWWGRAWARAVEESAYTQADLTAGRSIARSGRVGGIILDAGSFVAAVEDPRGLWTVSGRVPVLDADGRTAFLEAVAATPGRVAALLDRDLPHDLVEHAEEAGVELLPFGGEFSASCTCDGFLDPCPHAVALLVQAGWLVDADPLVMLALRGLDREALLARLHERSGGDLAPLGASVVSLADDVEVAADAVLRARRIATLFAAGQDLPDGLL